MASGSSRDTLPPPFPVSPEPEPDDLQNRNQKPNPHNLLGKGRRKLKTPITIQELMTDGVTMDFQTGEDWDKEMEGQGAIGGVDVGDAGIESAGDIASKKLPLTHTQRPRFNPHPISVMSGCAVPEVKTRPSPTLSAISANSPSGKKLFRPLNFPDPIVKSGESGKQKFSRIGQLTLPIHDFKELLTKYKFDDVVPDGGIKKSVRRIGKNYVTPPEIALFWIHYKMIVESYDEPAFCTSEPFKFQSGEETIMPWLDYCVSQMHLGEISYFLVGPKYGFGEVGVSRMIDPGASALFEIELKHFMAAPEHSIKDIQEMSQAELSELSFGEIEKFVKVYKNRAKDDIKFGNWDKACFKYRKVLKILENYLTLDANDQVGVDQLIFELYNNSALCWLKLDEFQEAKVACNACLDLPEHVPGNRAKVYYRLGSAEYGLGNYDEALKVITKAKLLASTDKNILALQYSIQEKLNADNEASKKLYTKMFGKTKN